MSARLDPPRRGHYPVRIGVGDWRCACGDRLSGGPYGNGRAGARDVMRFHRLDLRYAARPIDPEAVSDGR